MLKKKSRFVNAYEKYLEHIPIGLPASTLANAIAEALSSPDPKPRNIMGSNKKKVKVRLRPYIQNRLFKYPRE